MQKLVEQAPNDLYITKHYEITCFTTENKTGYYSNNFLVRIINSFITALNASTYLLPSALVIMLHNSYLKDQHFAEKQMPKLIEKLLGTLLETVRLRKKQVGYPFIMDNQPKIILLRPVPRPAYSLLNPEQHKCTRRKFASEIEEITYHYRVQLVNLDELNCSQRVLFNEYGNLSDYGIERFWKSLSDHFRRADRDEYNAIKMYRIPKKTIGLQTYTQVKQTKDQDQKPPQQNLTQNPFRNSSQTQQPLASPPVNVQQPMGDWYNRQPIQHNYQQAAGDFHQNQFPNNHHHFNNSFH